MKWFAMISLLYAAWANAAFTPATELRIQPIIGMSALELALLYPTLDADDYSSIGEERAAVIERMRLSLIARLQDGFKPSKDSVQCMLAVALAYIERLLLTGKPTETGDELFLSAMRYLQRYGAGISPSQHLKSVFMDTYLTLPGLSRFQSSLRPIIEETLDAMKGRPEALPSSLGMLSDFDDHHMDLFWRRVQDEASAFVENPPARQETCEDELVAKE